MSAAAPVLPQIAPPRSRKLPAKPHTFSTARKIPEVCWPYVPIHCDLLDRVAGVVNGVELKVLLYLKRWSYGDYEANRPAWCAPTEAELARYAKCTVMGVRKAIQRLLERYGAPLIERRRTGIDHTGRNWEYRVMIESFKLIGDQTRKTIQRKAPASGIVAQRKAKKEAEEEPRKSASVSTRDQKAALKQKVVPINASEENKEVNTSILKLQLQSSEAIVGPGETRTLVLDQPVKELICVNGTPGSFTFRRVAGKSHSLHLELAVLPPTDVEQIRVEHLRRELNLRLRDSLGPVETKTCEKALQNLGEHGTIDDLLSAIGANSRMFKPSNPNRAWGGVIEIAERVGREATRAESAVKRPSLPEFIPPPPMPDDTGSAWAKIREHLRSSMPAVAWANWFSRSRQTQAAGTRITVGVPDDASKVFLEGDYLEAIEQAIQDLGLTPLKVAFVVWGAES